MRNVRLGLGLWAALLAAACGDDDGGGADAAPVVPDAPAGADAGGELDLAVCDPATGGPFTSTIDNPFFPLAVGQVWELEGTDQGALVHLTITVLDQTEVVAGVETRILEERETEDGELVEVSRNFFAQAPDGTVCYFGEEVDIYEAGQIVSHEGAWRADAAGNAPGIFMPAAPQVGDAFKQEVAPGVAEDHATIAAMGESVTVPAGTFDDTLRIVEDTPLEPGVLSTKVFARGEGLIVDDVLERLP